jgi:glyoxylase-like metal-dependent hydrolase (beta-lactamase superfamily II)
MAMTAAAAHLPPQAHVFVRDWLSANNILLKSADGHVLIDTGYIRHAPLTLALLTSRSGLEDAPLSLLVNTHCHSDHMGGNAAIKARYGCPLALPVGETALIDAWDDQALLLRYCDQDADRFGYEHVIHPGEVNIWGGLEWRALAAPGHDMGALVFYNAEHRILVSGDALWENGYGFVMPPEIDARALPAARATLEMIAGLDARTVIPGHGEPFSDVNGALARAFSRTAAFDSDTLRTARHALKVVLSFALLDKRQMRLDALPQYLATVPIYVDFNARFFRMPPADLAELLVGELSRARAVQISDGWLRPI